MAKHSKGYFFSLLLFGLVVITAFLVIYPILRIALYPDISDYLSFWQSRRYTTALFNSLWTTALAMTSCTAIAFVFAFTIVRLVVPLKRLFRFVTLLPIVSPPFIVALSYILLFGTQGLVTKALLGLTTSIYGWFGLWIVQTITFFPFAFVVIEGVMTNIPENMEYAALNLGASRMRVFGDVFWPLCRPGIAGGAMMAAMNVLADFGNPMMIGGNLKLLPTEAYMQMAGLYNLNSATMLAMVLLLPIAAIFSINCFWISRRTYTTINGKESEMPRLAPHPTIKWGAFVLSLAVSLFVLLVYGVLVVGAFTRAWGYDWSLTLTGFKNVWARRDLIFNSLKFSALTALAASVIGLGLAYVVHSRQGKLARVADALGVVPGAIPGVFLGLGFSLAFAGKPFNLAGTGTLMVLALTVWNIPACYSTCHAALMQLGPSLENAARNSGASAGRSFWDVVLPVLWEPILSGFILTFLRSITCLSVVIFIYGASTSVSTVTILSLVNSGDWSGAAAFTVVVITIAFALMGIFQAIVRWITRKWKRRIGT